MVTATVSIKAKDLVIGDVLDDHRVAAKVVGIEPIDPTIPSVFTHPRIRIVTDSEKDPIVEVAENGAIRTVRELVVGMGATITIGGDDYPATVRSWSKSGSKIVVTRDRVRRAKSADPEASFGGLNPTNVALFQPVDDDPETFTLRKNGVYRSKGDGCERLILGYRTYRNDPTI
jgi:hypothetical protein